MFLVLHTEGLHDRQVSLDDTHGCSHDTGLLEHVTTSPGQHTVDSTHCNLGALQSRQEIIEYINQHKKKVFKL